MYSRHILSRPIWNPVPLNQEVRTGADAYVPISVPAEAFLSGTYQSVLTQVINASYRTYVSVPVCTALVQGGTRRYKEVPSGTKQVQGGTKRYQNGSEQYRQVHTGTYWSDVTQYIQVRTAQF